MRTKIEECRAVYQMYINPRTGGVRYERRSVEDDEGRGRWGPYYPPPVYENEKPPSGNESEDI